MSLIARIEYNSWRRSVNAYIAALSGGLAIDDIDNFPYKNFYDKEMTPRKTAESAIASLRKVS